MSLFHETCGSLLERDTVETDDGREASIGYCGECDEFADVELGSEWTLESGQEEDGITEILDNYDEDALKDYEFSDCEHGKAIQHEFPAARGDEDNFLMYECADCGNTERVTSTRF